MIKIWQENENEKGQLIFKGSNFFFQRAPSNSKYPWFYPRF